MSGQHEPVVTEAADGLVHIVAEPRMANAIADALEFTFASGGLDADFRPAYLLDVAAIRTAVAGAVLQEQREVAEVRYVPVGPAPRLRLVGGDV